MVYSEENKRERGGVDYSLFALKAARLSMHAVSRQVVRHIYAYVMLFTRFMRPVVRG